LLLLIESNPKKEESTVNKTKHSFSSILSLVEALVEIAQKAIRKFSSHLYVNVKRMSMTISTDDAAKTALLCGTAGQMITYMIELFRNNTHFRDKSIQNIELMPDFTKDKSSANIDIVFRIHMIGIFATLFCTLFAFIPRKDAILSFFNKKKANDQLKEEPSHG